MKYIIGDIFKSFCDLNNTVPFSALKAKNVNREKYNLGQGLTLNEINTLLKNNLFNNDFNKVDLASTHKHKHKNSLILNFCSHDDSFFTSDMYIHGDNDLLMDHLTGMHIPGIALIEAAREFFIVSLSYIGYGEYRFILKDIQSNFIYYIFPIEINLSINIKCIKESKKEKEFEATIKFHQQGKKCAECTISASLLPEKLAMFSERISAQQLNLLEG